MKPSRQCVFPMKALRKMLAVFFYLEPHVFVCQPALRHFRLPRQVLLQRYWEEFSSDQNIISHLTNGSWRHLSMGGENLSSQTQPAPYSPLFLSHQLAQICTLTSWLRSTGTSARYALSAPLSACYAFSAVADTPPPSGSIENSPYWGRPGFPAWMFFPAINSMPTLALRGGAWDHLQPQRGFKSQK